MRNAFARRAVGWALAAAAVVTPASAQQIVFDKPVRAGDLVFFRDLNVETDYYYVPSRPRLATDANGRPQFSFFRWVENVHTGAKDPEAREGTGGGIIHVLVTFGVPKEALREAEQELRRQRPGARIAGPIVPKSGNFTLVSSVKDPKGEGNSLASQVIGLGKAPLLDGDKAAVSVLLTKQGAKVLWEQFQTPTPDISFSFEVEIEGFRAPMRGLIEANLDEVMKHDSFAAGLASNWLGFEIKGAFDDLRKNNVIKVTQVGGDEAFNKLVDSAYQQLFGLLFSASETPAAASLPEADTSILDRATTWRNDARTHAAGIRGDNKTIRDTNAKRQALGDSAVDAERDEQELRRKLSDAEADTETMRRMAKNAAADADEQERQASAAEAADAPDAAALRKKAIDARRRADGFAEEQAAAAALATELKGQLGAATTAARDARRAATEAGAAEEERSGESDPGFALLGTYQLKRRRVSGVFRVDLNKYTSEARTFRFDENIGDLRSLFADSGHFRQVNLDDPLYRQREIMAVVDGANAEDFGQFVNFVTVRLRKKHEGGDLTHEEVRIDRKNFNQEGNLFKLLYGWKGDRNRSRWMDYEYQTVWSFFGGHQVELPWKPSSAGAINLAPPFQRHAVDLRADPKRLAEQDVRAVTVRVFYKTAPDAPEQVRQVTLNALGEAVAGRIEFVAPRGLVEYDYEITWRLTGNRTVASGHQTTNSTLLDVDELPKPTTGVPSSIERRQP